MTDMIPHTRKYVRAIMHVHSITQARTLYQREYDFNMNNINRNICNNLRSYMQLCISIAPPLPPLLLSPLRDSHMHAPSHTHVYFDGGKLHHEWHEPKMIKQTSLQLHRRYHCRLTTATATSIATRSKRRRSYLLPWIQCCQQGDVRCPQHRSRDK